MNVEVPYSVKWSRSGKNRVARSAPFSGVGTLYADALWEMGRRRTEMGRPSATRAWCPGISGGIGGCGSVWLKTVSLRTFVNQSVSPSLPDGCEHHSDRRNCPDEALFGRRQ